MTRRLWLAICQSAAVQGRLAFGPDAGRWAQRVGFDPAALDPHGTSDRSAPSIPKKLCANDGGFSLHTRVPRARLSLPPPPQAALPLRSAWADCAGQAVEDDRRPDRRRRGRRMVRQNGCVPVRFNRSGVRERPELRFGNKPEGQKHIVCLGDSFTFGWGIREEDNWVRLLENALREDHDEIRSVNCGAAGTRVVDEYRYGLEQRFHRFGPDMVLVTLCLNDLIPKNAKNAGLGHVQPPPDTPSALLDRVLLATHDPMVLDPSVAWIDLLLALPADDPIYQVDQEVSYEMPWPSGGPQQNLTLMRDWCAAREVAFGVILWPFLQGLGPDRRYPFQEIHDLVAAFCAAENIPFHDVLPALEPHDAASLWVHPTDWHPSPEAQRFALPGIEAFARALVPWAR